MALQRIYLKPLLIYWKLFIIIVVPLIFLPLILLYPVQESYCGYVVLVMAIYWMTEAVPLAITALIPVVMFPMFGIMDTGAVCIAYLKETNMMFIGGLIMALAVEHCNLHKRIALRVILLIGTSPRMLMLGFMLTTMFLSMWISNTATTAMMVPIVEAVLMELKKNNEDEKIGKVSIVEMSPISGDIPEVNMSNPMQMMKSSEELVEQESDQRPQRIMLLLAVAYSANIGGTGTITGTAPNLALKGILDDMFGGDTELNFATWMAFNVPGMIINVLLAWVWLQALYIGLCRKTVGDNPDSSRAVRKLVQRKYKELGPMRFHEAMVLILFITLVLLWFFRDPQFIPGWSSLITGAHVDDATAAMAIVFLLFVIPAKPTLPNLTRPTIGSVVPYEPLMKWSVVHEKLPWGVVLLLGGGFAMADATTASGLSSWLGNQLRGLDSLPPVVIIFIISLMTAMVTEVASNTATANIVLPVLANLSIAIGENPLYLMLPATLCCSYAFMLPVATPPNAIVFEASKMKSTDMIKAGLVMNLICVVVTVILINTYGVLLFDFHKFPEWANISTIAPSTTESLNFTISAFI